MATFFDLMVLDATMVQLHWALDKARTTNDPNLKNYTEATAQILEGTLHALSMMSKSSIIHSIKAELDENTKENILYLLSITGMYLTTLFLFKHALKIHPIHHMLCLDRQT